MSKRLLLLSCLICLTFSLLAQNETVTPVGSLHISSVPAKTDGGKPLSDVDRDIPLAGVTNRNTHVMIIANQNYTKEPVVTTALNDGRSVREYCIKTLGIPDNQVELHEDLSMGDMLGNMANFAKTMRYNREGHFMFFYFGHGMRNSDPTVMDAYLIPVDGTSQMLRETGISRNDMMKRFEQEDPDRLVVFLESCFSGGMSGATNKNDYLQYSHNSSGLRVADDVRTGFRGNIILLSASQGAQTANAVVAEGHNVFTLEFLRLLKQTKGNCKWGDFFDKLKQNTERSAWNILHLEQSPSITTGTTIKENAWRNWSVK